jgi:hypothetical protein
LEKPTPQRIEQLINDVIDSRVADHQLDACNLTFRELRIIAESFRFTLQSMLHRRIAYPKEDNANTISTAALGFAASNSDGVYVAVAERERERERRRTAASIQSTGGHAIRPAVSS